MAEEIEKLYQEYLKEKLDLVVEVDETKNYKKIENNGKYNYIDRRGNIVSETWYDDVFEFSEGYGLVRNEHKFNYIDAKGNLIGETWYDRAGSFSCGYAEVSKGNVFNYIDTLGNLLSKTWYYYAEPFYNGYAVVKINKGINHGYNYINTFGELMSKEYYDDESLLRYYMPLNLDGHELSQKDIKDTWKNADIEMNDYEVKKTLFGYTCSNAADSYKVKYKPIKRYGLRYTLCQKEDKAILYDRISNKYLQYDIKNFKYDDNFIFNNEMVYLMYEDKMIEITEYYNKYLKGQDITRINSGITGFMTKDEFCLLNRDKIDELFEKLKEEQDKKVEMEKQIETEKRLAEMRKIQERKEQAQNKKKKEALENIKQSLKILERTADDKDSLNKLEVDETKLFIEVNDHLEISPIYINTLKYLDLKFVKFDNVKVDGIDFRDTNICFDPQKVYKKNLSGCNFDKMFISPFMNFKGVNITGCTFSNDNDPLTYDTFNLTFKDAIYDDKTTYDGIPFSKILEENIKDNTEIRKSVK